MEVINTLKVLSIAILINLMSAKALANRDVSLLQIPEANWIFVPTTLDGSVESFVGLRTEGANGENITTVWFLRTTEGTWDSWAWSEQNQGKAIAYIKSILALPDSTDTNWPVAISTEAANVPKVLMKGVLKSDPYESVIDGLTDPKFLVTMLEDAGWAAAWLELWNYDCGDEVVLDTWADVYEYEYSSNENFKYIANRLLMQNDCFTTYIRDEIWCWVDQYWASFDAGVPISFNGRHLNLHPDWHPFDEIVQVYRSMYPSVPIVEALIDRTAWDALAPNEREAFRDLSSTHLYVELFTPNLYPADPQDGVPNLDPLVIPTTPDCGDHQLFYDKLLLYLDEMPWVDREIATCLWRSEGNWPLCGPLYDCYDDANTIGACLINKLSGDGFEVIAKNKGVWFKCGFLTYFNKIGHTYTCIFFCGYWYIVDGSNKVIAIIPGSSDEDVPIDLEVCRFLWSQGYECNGECFIEDAGEWDLHDSPWYEPNLWYTSQSEVARVVACLRAAGMTDAEITESFACSIPSEQLESVLQWFEPPTPVTPVPPYVPYVSPNNPCPECYTLEP